MSTKNTGQGTDQTQIVQDPWFFVFMQKIIQSKAKTSRNKLKNTGPEARGSRFMSPGMKEENAQDRQLDSTRKLNVRKRGETGNGAPRVKKKSDRGWNKVEAILEDRPTGVGVPEMGPD